MVKLFLVILILASGCQSQQIQKMKVGEVRKIELENIASTGYTWEHSSIDPKLMSIEHEIINKDNLVGGKSLIIFSLKALKKGKVRIVFELKRVWEKDVKPLETKTFDIEIK